MPLLHEVLVWSSKANLSYLYCTTDHAVYCITLFFLPLLIKNSIKWLHAVQNSVARILNCKYLRWYYSTNLVLALWHCFTFIVCVPETPYYWCCVIKSERTVSIIATAFYYMAYNKKHYYNFSLLNESKYPNRPSIMNQSTLKFYEKTPLATVKYSTVK